MAAEFSSEFKILSSDELLAEVKRDAEKAKALSFKIPAQSVDATTSTQRPLDAGQDDDDGLGSIFDDDYTSTNYVHHARPLSSVPAGPPRVILAKPAARSTTDPAEATISPVILPEVVALSIVVVPDIISDDDDEVEDAPPPAGRDRCQVTQEDEADTDEDKFWDEGCDPQMDVARDAASKERVYKKRAAKSDNVIESSTRPSSSSSTKAPVPRGKRLFGVASGAAEEGKPAKEAKVVVPKPKVEQEEDDDDDDPDGFDVRPIFNDENVAAGREDSLHAISPLVLDARHIVHAWANRYLRQYQREGIQFLFRQVSENLGAVLNDDMGLGKTVQVISFCLALLGKQGNLVDKRRAKARRKARESKAQSLASPDPRTNGTILIVAPKSILTQWGRELETWGYFDWEDLSAKEGDAAKQDLVQACQASTKNNVQCNPEILLMPYSILGRSLVKDKEKARLLHDLFKTKFRLVVFDEVHTLKNLTSNQTSNARKLLAWSRIGLTGTIMQNNLKEFYTVLTTVHPKAFTSDYKEFNREYAVPIKMARNKTASDEIVALGCERAKKVRSTMDKCLLRRTKALIQDQLPKKKENIVFCKLTDLQQRVYQRIANGRDAILLKFAKDECGCGRINAKRGECCFKQDPEAPLWRQFHPDDEHCKRCPWCLQLPMISKLINCCNHLDLLKVDPNKDTPHEVETKTAFAREAFGEDVEAIGGFERATQFEQVSNHDLSGKLFVLGQLLSVWKLQPTSRILVFSHYTRILDIIGKYLDRSGMVHCRIDGSTPAHMRTLTVDNFNNLENKNNFVFLISTKAGGLGLNLTAANIVVLFDSSWNPSFDVQAQDRAYRLGQRRDVDVYRLISTGTIEDKTYCRQLYKMQLSSEALEGNREERFFEGVQGDANQQGELFGVANLIDYNPAGHMANLKAQYKWKSPVSASKMSAATRAAMQASVRGGGGGFIVEAVGEVKEDGEELLGGLEEEELFGDIAKKPEVEDELELARRIWEANGLAASEPGGEEADADLPLPESQGVGSQQRKKKKKVTSLADNLTRIVESGGQFQADEDDDLITEDDEDEGQEGGQQEDSDDPVEDIKTDDEEEDELKWQVGNIIQNHSHMAVNASDLLKGKRQKEDEK